MTDPVSLPERNRCNCSSLRKASRRLSQFYDVCLAASGLKSTQFAILSEINRRHNAPTIGEMAGALAMDASTVGQNLRPLERDGLISIDAALDDRRRRNIRLTQKGGAAYAAAVPLWAEAQARFERQFGEADAAGLRALLAKIVSEETFASPA
jgi:DNA-binding MarR family transcriptional regulator